RPLALGKRRRPGARLDRGDVERECEPVAHPLYQLAVAGPDLPYQRGAPADQRCPADTPQPGKAARGGPKIVRPSHQGGARRLSGRSGWFRIGWRRAAALR
ncbi:MAG TPA: hypothetical protein VG126_04135, partial [Thermoleophilaceae bacterium]|nr:hypothetical protein [Thermoleophilaceae bacterium]